METFDYIQTNAMKILLAKCNTDHGRKILDSECKLVKKVDANLLRICKRWSLQGQDASILISVLLLFAQKLSCRLVQKTFDTESVGCSKNSEQYRMQRCGPQKNAPPRMRRTGLGRLNHVPRKVSEQRIRRTTELKTHFSRVDRLKRRARRRRLRRMKPNKIAPTNSKKTLNIQ